MDKDIVVTDEIKCICCESIIKGKPWITVSFKEDDYTVHACRYLCAKDLRYKVGPEYWKNVVNKEDFDHIRPVLNYRTNKDITTNFGIDELREEIKREETRVSLLEMEYNYDSNTSEEDD
tara:strand:+ start:2025 stop:2384 length:360 start_codon:yes stop_codon:yes gene_type:complete